MRGLRRLGWLRPRLCLAQMIYDRIQECVPCRSRLSLGWHIFCVWLRPSGGLSRRRCPWRRCCRRSRSWGRLNGFSLSLACLWCVASFCCLRLRRIQTRCFLHRRCLLLFVPIFSRGSSRYSSRNLWLQRPTSLDPRSGRLHTRLDINNSGRHRGDYIWRLLDRPQRRCRRREIVPSSYIIVVP